MQYMRILGLPEGEIEAFVNRLDVFVDGQLTVSSPQFIRLVRLIISFAKLQIDVCCLADSLQQVCSMVDGKFPFSVLKAVFGQISAVTGLHFHQVLHSPYAVRKLTKKVGTTALGLADAFIEQIEADGRFVRKAKERASEWLHLFVVDLKNFPDEKEEKAFWKAPMVTSEEFKISVLVGWVELTTHASFTLIRWHSPAKPEPDADDLYEMEVLQALLAFEMERDEESVDCLQAAPGIPVAWERLKAANSLIWERGPLSLDDYSADSYQTTPQDRWRWAVEQLRSCKSFRSETKPQKRTPKDLWKEAFTKVIQGHRAGLDMRASIQSTAPLLRWKRAIRLVQSGQLRSPETSKAPHERWREAFVTIKERGKIEPRTSIGRPSTSATTRSFKNWRRAFGRVRENLSDRWQERGNILRDENTVPEVANLEERREEDSRIPPCSETMSQRRWRDAISRVQEEQPLASAQ